MYHKMKKVSMTSHQQFKTHWSGALLFVAAIVTIYFGWQISPERYITAENGAGYALGIIGGVMMLMLLLYPLRKRARWMRNFGPSAYNYLGIELFNPFNNRILPVDKQHVGMPGEAPEEEARQAAVDQDLGADPDQAYHQMILME